MRKDESVREDGICIDEAHNESNGPTQLPLRGLRGVESTSTTDCLGSGGMDGRGPDRRSHRRWIDELASNITAWHGSQG